MLGISVVIPCYNAGKYLREALESVMAQEYPGPVEVLVGDDGSIDESIAIAESFGTRVQVLRKPASVKSNLAANRNRCIRASSYPFITFLDADDCWLHGHLSALASVMMARPDVALAYDNGFHISADGKVLGPRLSASHRPIMTADDLLPDCCLAVNGVMVRRSVLKCVGLFDEDLSSVDDHDLWLRILEKFPAVYVPIFGFCYRMHGNQVSKMSPIFWNLASTVLERARNRYPYKKSSILKRSAVLAYHHGVHAYRERRIFRATWLLGKAALLDPKRAFSELGHRLVKMVRSKLHA